MACRLKDKNTNPLLQPRLNYIVVEYRAWMIVPYNFMWINFYAYLNLSASMAKQVRGTYDGWG